MPTAADPTIRPAASAVIIRDGRDGLEVFMMERNRGAGMAFSGAFVFPGGKVDAEDHAETWAPIVATSVAHPARAYWIAAIRETFEEAGLLLARRPHSEHVIGAEDAHRLVMAERGAPRSGRSARFAEMVRREELRLAVDSMIHFGHWITPTWAPKRFDAHFFLTAAPFEQRENLDHDESAEGLWIRPAEALAQADAKRRTLVDVTRFTLELLDTWPDVATALEAARRRRIVTIMPRIEDTPAGKMIRIPEDSGYTRFEMRPDE